MAKDADELGFGALTGRPTLVNHRRRRIVQRGRGKRAISAVCLANDSASRSACEPSFL